MLSDRSRPIAAAAAVALCSVMLASACGGDGDEDAATAPTQTTTTTQGNGQSDGQGNGKAKFEPSSFGAPATGANKWLPLEPGTQTVRLGKVNRGDRRLTHRVVTTVTDVSKEVDGVRTVVILDQDIDAGQVAEQALDYLAEDKQGNVWYVGSYTEAYEGGQFVNAADAWLSGVKGGAAGILMKADPQTGQGPYVQARIPGDEVNIGEVVKTGQSNCVPFKCYKNVLVVEEGGEHKYFAPGVGHIRTEPTEKGGEQEVEELINFTQLSPRALRELSTEVLKLDKHAAEVSKDVFGSSSPAKRDL